MASPSFEYPFFYNYPPYFTLQPVLDTQEKQKELWRELILKYCRFHKVFVLCCDTEDELPLFNNKQINRRLTREAKEVFLGDLVKRGRGMWLDKGQRYCLVLWKTLEDWADTIYELAVGYGLTDDVVILDELSNGDEVAGTELQGVHREVLLRALKLLEGRGKAKLFRGATPEEEGVKFF